MFFWFPRITKTAVRIDGNRGAETFPFLEEVFFIRHFLEMAREKKKKIQKKSSKSFSSRLGF
jgi:hypothetical protein